MATYAKYEVFVEDLIEGVHDFDGHTFHVALTNTAPNLATNELLAQATELTTTGGYTAGGNPTTITTSRAGGTAKVVGTDPTVWTGSGAGFTFSHAILFNQSTAIKADPLIANWPYGSSQLVGVGETLTVDFDATNGIFTIT